MDGYRIEIATSNGPRVYRHGGEVNFDLAEAAEIADGLLERNTSALYVTVGNGEHEFRLTAEQDGDRHAEWYVDVELGGKRWRYRPMADLDSYEASGEVGEPAEALDEVSRVWIGRSDGSEEYETEAV